MKALFELSVVILFFITYIASKNIVLATAVAVVAGVVQAAVLWLKHRKLQTMQWLSLVLIVVFGGATILLQDAQFIMWKPTVLFWLMAAALMVAHLLGKQPLKAATASQALQLPDAVWGKLNIAWISFFMLMGCLNLWVAYRFSEAQWVNYKLFGSTGLILIFAIAQALYIQRHLSRLGNKEKP